MMRRLRIARINWHTTDTGNGMPVHRAFDVMAPLDVHSARCLAIQPGRAASSPPRAGRNFFGPCKRSIYWAFAISKCRYRAERLANRASQGVENPWNLIAICSGSRRLELSHYGSRKQGEPGLPHAVRTIVARLAPATGMSTPQGPRATIHSQIDRQLPAEDCACHRIFLTEIPRCSAQQEQSERGARL